MTVLGQHTIQETHELMATIEFRIAAIQKLMKDNPGFLQKPDGPAAQAAFLKWLDRWRKVSTPVGLDLLQMRIFQPLVPSSLIVCEPQYKKIRCAINVGCGDTFTKGDFADVLRGVELVVGRPINEKDAPQPSQTDPDLNVFNQLDRVIRAGEAGAQQAVNKTGEIATSNKGLLVIGGIAALGAGYIAAKVYL